MLPGALALRLMARRSRRASLDCGDPGDPGDASESDEMNCARRIGAISTSTSNDAYPDAPDAHPVERLGGSRYVGVSACAEATSDKALVVTTAPPLASSLVVLRGGGR